MERLQRIIFIRRSRQMQLLRWIIHPGKIHFMHHSRGRKDYIQVIPKEVGR